MCGIWCGAVSSPPPQTPLTHSSSSGMEHPPPTSLLPAAVLALFPASHCFSWASSVCTTSHRGPLCCEPSFWCWCWLPAVPGVWKAQLWIQVYPSNPHPCFPFLPPLGGCCFSGRSTAPLTVSLAAQRRSELCSVVEDHSHVPLL